MSLSYKTTVTPKYYPKSYPRANIRTTKSSQNINIAHSHRLNHSHKLYKPTQGQQVSPHINVAPNAVTAWLARLCSYCSKWDCLVCRLLRLIYSALFSTLLLACPIYLINHLNKPKILPKCYSRGYLSKERGSSRLKKTMPAKPAHFRH